MRKFSTGILLLAVYLLLPELAEAQCAMCKAVVESSIENSTNVLGGSSSIGEGLNKGIIILMVVPYVLLFLLFRTKIVSFLREFSQAQG